VGSQQRYADGLDVQRSHDVQRRYQLVERQ